MQSFLTFFGFGSVDAILASFNRKVAQLEALTNRMQERAAKQRTQAALAQQKAKDADEEANRAKAAAQRIRTIIGE